jgi:hypothetical protein
MCSDGPRQAQPGGKRHGHHRRIPGALLEQVEARLQGIGRKLAKAANFAALHRLVEGIGGIGALTDIAHRIGAHFKKGPELVYQKLVQTCLTESGPKNCK